MVWFTADPHFGHKNIIKYCNRPFVDADEMDAKLIENWNKNVKPDDKVYILGDFCFPNNKKEAVERYARQLNGELILIKGNHDDYNIKEWGIFKEVKVYKEVIENNHSFVLFHYPLETWHHIHRGVIHLFGHVHNSPFREMPRRINVGIDMHPEYRPFNIYEVIKLAGENEI